MLVTYRIIIALILTAVYHIVHEYAHILMAKLNGIGIEKIHWLTYGKLGGTRIYYEDEPDISQENIELKWGLIAVAGFLGTTLVGYTFIAIYLTSTGKSFNALILYIGSMLFLTADPLYYILGSILGFGDIIGVRKAFHLSKASSIIISIMTLIINGTVLYFTWFRTIKQ